MSSKAVITVCGELPPGDLGAVLAHEHLICDFTLTGGQPQDRISDWTVIPHELEILKKAGGGAIFELTLLGLGDNPPAPKKRLARLRACRSCTESVSTSKSYPKWVWSATSLAIADFFVRHIEEGEGGVRAGLIGEIASHNELLPDAGAYRLHDCEAKVFCAAAQAHRRTGVAISTHACLGRAGHAQLDTLERPVPIFLAWSLGTAMRTPLLRRNGTWNTTSPSSIVAPTWNSTPSAGTINGPEA